MTTSTNPRRASVLSQLRALRGSHYGGPTSACRLAESQAAELLRLTGHHSAAPVPSQIISHLPRVEVRLADIPTSGLSVWDGERWVINLNRFEPTTRQRFTLLHEYKHIIDHPHRHWLYHDRQGVSAVAQAEQAADYFAGCVLAPREVLTQLWRSGVTDASELARRFELSVPAIEVRLRQVGVERPAARCSRPAAAVGSQERSAA